MLINLGLVGPKAKAKAETDGQRVNIPVLHTDRPSKAGAKYFVDSNPSGRDDTFYRVKVALTSGGRWWLT
jgi:hypothetical protein